MSKLGYTFLAAAALAALPALSPLSAALATAAAHTSSTCVKGQGGACEDPPVAKRQAIVADHGVPHKTCRGGFLQQGNFLCMTAPHDPATFANAMLTCMDQQARVADYHDWRYRNQRGDGQLPPVGMWLGGITADDTALFANRTDSGNFDGETSRFDLRPFVCAHDIGK
jgi:hypothetical protein